MHRIVDSILFYLFEDECCLSHSFDSCERNSVYLQFSSYDSFMDSNLFCIQVRYRISAWDLWSLAIFPFISSICPPSLLTHSHAQHCRFHSLLPLWRRVNPYSCPILSIVVNEIVYIISSRLMTLFISTLKCTTRLVHVIPVYDVLPCSLFTLSYAQHCGTPFSMKLNGFAVICCILLIFEVYYYERRWCIVVWVLDSWTLIVSTCLSPHISSVSMPGFYHWAMMRTIHTTEPEPFWEVAKRCSDDIGEAVKNRKHVTDMEDLSAHMVQAMRFPNLTSNGTMRTAVISTIADIVVEDLAWETLLQRVVARTICLARHPMEWVPLLPSSPSCAALLSNSLLYIRLLCLPTLSCIALWTPTSLKMKELVPCFHLNGV